MTPPASAAQRAPSTGEPSKSPATTFADLVRRREQLRRCLRGLLLTLAETETSTRLTTLLATRSGTDSVLAALCDLTDWIAGDELSTPSELFAHLSRTLPEAQSRHVDRVIARARRFLSRPSSRSNGT